ncbi:MAG: KamA family radical SAM protein [Deltaproteobacteria bacterium]|nr:KamA family radical SAM protein [Deltaproteobacteria bacterium]
MARKKKTSWKAILSKGITTPEALSAFFEINETDARRVIARYPMRINPYYLGLIRQKGDALYKQCIPDMAELSDEKGLEDPLNEEGFSPVPGLTHRYPDRVLFLVSSQCAMYCRFCNRKRKVGSPSMATNRSIREGLSYIRGHKEIRDVLLSGGDPLLLEDERLYGILSRLRDIGHVEIIRIGTRVPCALPHRVTPQLAKLLKGFHPLYMLTHFNHPVEITPEASMACNRLAHAGIPLGCQTVLLKGVNDDPLIIKALMQKLLTIRVRPYYLFQADLARGTSHFWTPVSRGMEIMAGLHGHTSGLCVPHFAIDLPGGGGKVPLLPEYIKDGDGDSLLIRDYQGKEHQYPPEWGSR